VRAVRDDSDNENSYNRQTYERKRVFTEEPPIRRSRRSPSPEKERHRNTDAFYANSDSESDRDSVNGRHLIKSAVKVSEDIPRHQKERENSGEIRDNQRHESQVDLTDIPLPNTDTNSNKV
jgi:hypothetical protein